MTLFVFINMPPKHYKKWETAKKNLDQFSTLDLDQFLTQETQILDQFLTLQRMCIYIYTHINRVTDNEEGNNAQRQA